jgi:hypothetical protein
VTPTNQVPRKSDPTRRAIYRVTPKLAEAYRSTRYTGRQLAELSGIQAQHQPKYFRKWYPFGPVMLPRFEKLADVLGVPREQAIRVAPECEGLFSLAELHAFDNPEQG